MTARTTTSRVVASSARVRGDAAARPDLWNAKSSNRMPQWICRRRSGRSDARDATVPEGGEVSQSSTEETVRLNRTMHPIVARARVASDGCGPRSRRFGDRIRGVRIARSGRQMSSAIRDEARRGMRRDRLARSQCREGKHDKWHHWLSGSAPPPYPEKSPTHTASRFKPPLDQSMPKALVCGGQGRRASTVSFRLASYAVSDAAP